MSVQQHVSLAFAHAALNGICTQLSMKARRSSSTTCPIGTMLPAVSPGIHQCNELVARRFTCKLKPCEAPIGAPLLQSAYPKKWIYVQDCWRRLPCDSRYATK
eukprot:5698042-Pleurochrysis_carterae.AAC.1